MNEKPIASTLLIKELNCHGDKRHPKPFSGAFCPAPAVLYEGAVQVTVNPTRAAGEEERERKRKLESREESRGVGTVKALFCVGTWPAPGQRCSSLLPAHWPPPHPHAHSALRASIKYSFSKTSTYITSTTSMSPCWPDWTEQCVTPTEEQITICAASEGSAALAHSE